MEQYSRNNIKFTMSRMINMQVHLSPYYCRESDSVFSAIMAINRRCDILYAKLLNDH